MTTQSLVLTLLLVPAAVSPATPPAQVVDEAADVAAIKRMYEARASGIQEHGALGYAEAFAEDGMLMPPNAAAVVGRDSIRRWAEDFFSSYSIRFMITSEEIQVSGDLAVRRFTASGTYTSSRDGEITEFDQKYLDILRRQADGTWRISHHAWSSNNYLPSVWDDDWKKGGGPE